MRPLWSIRLAAPGLIRTLSSVVASRSVGDVHGIDRAELSEAGSRVVAIGIVKASQPVRGGIRAVGPHGLQRFAFRLDQQVRWW